MTQTEGKNLAIENTKILLYPVLGFSVIKYFHIIDPYWSWVQSLEMRKSTVNKLSNRNENNHVTYPIHL